VPVLVDVARADDGGRILVIDQREPQVLDGGMRVPPLVGESKRTMNRLLQTARECRHRGLFAQSQREGRRSAREAPELKTEFRHRPPRFRKSRPSVRRLDNLWLLGKY